MTLPFNPERASPALRRICALAMSDAVRLHHPTVGTEHFLSAIMGDQGKDNHARRVLLAAGATPARVLAELLKLEIPMSNNKPPLKLAAKAQLIFSTLLWDGPQPKIYDTPHLLRAIALHTDCAAMRMLEAIGVPAEKVWTLALGAIRSEGG
jgi:ATP-dependent Clp protease ATP-binding subunit ClpA